MKEYEFKGSTVDIAIEKGLKKLGITKEQAEIEVINGEGIFTKATVKIIPLENAEIEENIEETVEEESIEISEEEVKSEQDEEVKTEKSGEKSRKNHRERKEYFSKEKEIGKEYVATIASYFSDKVRVDAKSYEDEICFYIGGDDAKKFIGHRGETLDAIQYLANQFINKDKDEEDHVRVTVDADFYRERRKRILSSLAKKLAQQAYNERREISLEPMNSYERRIIHSALQNSLEATTRSEGEGKDRHIVIVPNCEVMTYGNVSSDFRKKGPGRTKTYGGKKVIF